MELFTEILAKVLEEEQIHIVFPNLKINAAEIVEMQCYKALQKQSLFLKMTVLPMKSVFLELRK